MEYFVINMVVGVTMLFILPITVTNVTVIVIIVNTHPNRFVGRLSDFARGDERYGLHIIRSECRWFLWW